MKSLKVLFFCLLRYGPGVTQIQRHINRDDFDVSRMTTHYGKIRKRKTKQNTISNKKKHVICRRYSKATPDVVKKIRIMIFKTNQAAKRDILN